MCTDEMATAVRGSTNHGQQRYFSVRKAPVMEVTDYVGEEETIQARAVYHSDPYALFSSGKEGEIVATGSQFLQTSGDTITAISFDEVGSIEYTEPEMPRTYLLVGVLLIIFALLSTGPYATLAWVVGPVLLLTAYWLRTSQLTIYTPSRRFDLQSRDDDLVDVVKSYQSHQAAVQD